MNTSPHGFLHRPHDRVTFDDSEDERRAFFEKMWNSPVSPKLTSNYTDLLLDPRPTPSGATSSPRRSPASCTIRTRRKLIPKDHRFGEHRPPFVTGYYEAYNRPNVTLVDVKETPIVRVTPNGIETTEGERELDVIVWATGFDFGTGAPAHGDPWTDGVPRAALGRRAQDVPRRADQRLPELLLPGWAARGGGEQPAVQRRPGRFRHRHAPLRA